MKSIFVLLPAHRDASKHASDFAAGLAADESPWGFSKARNRGYRVEFSQGSNRSRLERVVRHTLGFDFIHAWRRRHDMGKADIILTHTENEYLAAALALRLSGTKSPILQGNTLWLFYEWSKLNAIVKLIVRYCLVRVDVLTCNAMPNVARGSQLSAKAVSYIPYGISLDSFPLSEPRLRLDGPLLAVGNDRARDWDAIVDVANAYPETPIRIASSSAPKSLSQKKNVTVASTAGVRETNLLYDEARLVLVPVRKNWHASGITVILEAAARGVPVIACDAGGLRDYFDDDEILFYGPKCERKNIMEAIRAAIEDPYLMRDRAEKAQSRLLRSSYDSQSFIDRLLACVDADPIGEGARE